MPSRAELLARGFRCARVGHIPDETGKTCVRCGKPLTEDDRVEATTTSPGFDRDPGPPEAA